MATSYHGMVVAGRRGMLGGMRCLLVVLAGCWSTAAAPPAAPQPPLEVTAGTWRPAHVADRCTTVVPHVYAYIRADPSVALYPGGMLDELEAATLEHCRTTAWSDEALDCYQKSSDIRDTSGCFEKMTTEQRDSWNTMFQNIYLNYQSSFNPKP
jgi:hypothetical protein